MGVVWAAEHLTLGTEVAVKFIRRERVATDPALLARFEREAKTLARIVHPNVVRIMDFGAEGSTPYIVMELLQGYSLAELFERGGRLSLATACALVQQVAGALAAAHDEGIVHRDIKPQNIFVTGTDPLCFKVLDFGVAKLLRSSSAALPSELTETGVVIGSAPYMSPEQLEAKGDVDFRSDLWSLGVIVYEALTGMRPFSGSSLVTVGAAVLQGQYQPASQHRAGLPLLIDQWLAKALSGVGERFQSAREMANAFPDFEMLAALESDSPKLSLLAEPRVPDAVTTLDHAPVASAPRATRRSWPLTRVVLGGAAGLGLLVAVGLNSRSLWATSGSCPADMQLIPRARFAMGSQVAADTPSDETTLGSLNLVEVAAFCIDRTEVTASAYSQCTNCDPPKHTVEFEGLTPNGRSFESQFCNDVAMGNHPINCVDWNEAKTYCRSIGRRLPSEAEWEFAARGTAARSYPWGNSAPSAARLNLCGSECSKMLATRLGKTSQTALLVNESYVDSATTTAPVGSYPAGATPEGLLDLAGNVWEWTASPYCPYPFRTDGDCGDSRRVLRGGGWDTTEHLDVRAARRYPATPSARGKSVGFRCAKDP